MVKVSYFPLTKFSGVTKHLKMIYFSKIIFRKIFYGETNTPKLHPFLESE
jgi:hypothetical protein